jgi:phosphopantetheinyl transferase
MATHAISDQGSAGLDGWRRHFERTTLGGREMACLFLSPEVVFFRYLLKEALARPSRFLTGREMEHFRSLSVNRRRIEWLAGRLNLKLLLSKFLGRGHDFQSFEILPGAAGHPVASLRCGGLMQIPIRNGLSLSHREGATASAVSADPDVEVGIDVELMEARDRVMLDDYFHPSEADLLDALPGRIAPCGIALGWSIKESVLKAMGTGLAAPARSVVIEKLCSRSGMAEVSSGRARYMVRFTMKPPYLVTLASRTA